MSPKDKGSSQEFGTPGVTISQPENDEDVVKPENDRTIEVIGSVDDTNPTLRDVEGKILDGKVTLAILIQKPTHDKEHPAGYTTGTVNGTDWDFKDTKRIPIVKLGKVNTIGIWADFDSTCYGRQNRYFVPVPDSMSVSFLKNTGDCTVFDNNPMVIVTRQGSTKVWKGDVGIGGNDKLYVKVTQHTDNGVSKFKVEFGCGAAEVFHEDTGLAEPDGGETNNNFFVRWQDVSVMGGTDRCCANNVTIDVTITATVP